jgi:hypothetical protein
MKRTLLTMGLGAGLMYLLDPNHGEERRTQLGDKIKGLLPQTSEALQHKAEELTSQAHSLTSKADEIAAEKIETASTPLDNIAGGAASGGSQGDESHNGGSKE